MKWTFNRRFQNIYFRRLFLSYSIVTIVISTLCGAILYNNAKRAAEDKQERDSRNKLGQVKTYVEELYPGIFKNAFISEILTTMNTGNGTDDAFTSFYKEYGHNLYQIYRVANHLKTTVSANPGTESVSVYFKNSNLMVDPYAYYKLSAHSPKYGLIAELEQGRLATDQWLARSVPYEDKLTDQLLTYIYTFPIQARGGEISGYMFIDIYKEHIRDMLDSLLGSQAEKLLMVNVKQQFIAGSSNIGSPELDQYWAKLAGNPAAASRQNGRLLSVLGGYSPGNDWVFASVQPVGSAAIRWPLALVGAGLLLFGILISYYISVKTYRPVQHMLRKLRETNGGLFPAQAQQQNEFKVVDYVLSGLNHKVKQLTGELDDNKLAALLNGILGEDEYPEKIRPDGRYIVVNVKLDRDTVKTWKTKLRKLSHPFHCEIVEISAVELGLLYFVGESEHAVSGIREELLKLASQQEPREASFAAGIGGLALHAEDISKSHEQAAVALRYTFLDRVGSIVDYGAISRRTEMPVIAYEPLENALRAGDIPAIEQFVEEFAGMLRRDTLSLEAVEFSLMQITMVLSRVMIDINSQERMYSPSLLFRDLRQDSFRETIATIRERCLQIGGHIRQHLLHHAQHDVFYKLKTYIDEHLKEDISLDTLSEMAGLSTHYLSRQFKEVHGVSFLEYMTNARLERACELLRNERRSVTEIADQVGYSNAPYFCTKFKHKYGVTPMQYRNSYRIALEE